MKIKATECYSFKKITDNEILETKHRISLLLMIVNSSLTKEYLLKPMKIGAGKGGVYCIKGKNLIKYLKESYDEKNNSGEEVRKTKSS